MEQYQYKKCEVCGKEIHWKAEYCKHCKSFQEQKVVITKYRVVLTNIGENKIQVIKLLRELIGLNMSEANELLENLPQDVAFGVSELICLRIQNKFSSLGATVKCIPIKEKEPKNYLYVIHKAGKSNNAYNILTTTHCSRCGKKITDSTEKALGLCTTCSTGKSNNILYIIGCIIAVFLFICLTGSIIT